ncbi:MAG: response regulator [Ignavibacteriae bacterium]|nr:response regulator [Ignavibacteriota bacterium]
MNSTIRILHLEDNENDSELVKELLHREGVDCELVCVDTRSEFIKALEQGTFDLIISDYTLPSFSGDFALALARERAPEIPYIFVSGTLGEEAAIESMKRGATDYVLKHRLERLVPAVRRALKETEERKRRRQAEEKLLQSEEQFRLIAENVYDLIAVLDLEGIRLYNSPSYKNILADPALLRGTDSFREIHPEDREKIKSIFFETVRTGIGQRAEFRFVTKDGSVRFIESQGSVIKDKNGKVARVIVVSRDVTERKKLEEQIMRAQRMESIGTLAGGVAHDLNNVLAPILMSLELLKRRFSDNQNKPLLDALETSVNRGASMVRQILTFARGVAGERMILQPKHLIEEMRKIADEIFPKSIHFQTDVAKNLWTVSGDATQLHQVLLNLCVNARDAMPQGGNLKISAENIELDENYARMNIDAKAGSYVVITVMDNGTGMPPDILDKIFEPFFTTKEVGKGTGLGLSTAHAIVKSHGGFINVYSEVGKGTKFKIYLPASDEAERQAVKEEPRELPMGHGEVVLVADDEIAIQEITKTTLENYGYRVITASDGTEAVASYVEHKAEVDIVITDMMMPYMDGPATIRALQKINPDIKILAVSGLVENQKITEITESKTVRFLQKPFTAEKLLVSLHEFLQG